MKKNTRFPKAKKVAIVATFLFSTAGVASASIQPFADSGLGGIFNGGIFGGDSSGGGTFYDFESVFSEGSSGGGGGILSIFGDLFGGIDGLGIIEDIIG